MARYKVLGELGRGGMGVVYRVLQTELGREVAMKVMLGGKDADPKYLRRFEREIDALIRLEHPNIVRLYDRGASEDSPFFTMELIKGRSLHDVVEKGGPLAPQRIVRILDQILDALDYVHQKGIVHRDVKPRNIMLCDDDHAVVMDFGLVLDPQRTALTGHGAMVGTPRYMAPETVIESVYGPTTDLYAVGTVGYEMATGFPAVPKNASLELMVASIVRDSPPAIREARPGFPAELESFLFALMEKKAEKRPGMAEARRMLADLDAGVPLGLPERELPPDRAPETGETGVAVSGSTPATGAPRRRPRAVLAVAGAVLGTLGIVAVIFVTAPPRPPVSVRASSAAAASPSAEEAAPPLDLTAELRRFQALGTTLAESFRIQKGAANALGRSLQTLENVSEMVPRLLTAVAQLDGLLEAALPPGKPGTPETMLLPGIASSILGQVQYFFTLEARSDALKERAGRLARHFDPSEKDLYRQAAIGILTCQIDLAIRPSLIGHRTMAEALVRAFDLTESADPAWKNAPEGLQLRTAFLEDACARYRRYHAGVDVDRMEMVQQTRARLARTLPDLARLVDAGEVKGGFLEVLVTSHVRGMADYLVVMTPKPEEARPRLAMLERLLDQVATRTYTEEQMDLMARASAVLEERAEAMGLSFRVPATVRWTSEIQALRRRPRRSAGL